MPFEEDDPVIASYDVVIASSPARNASSDISSSSGLYILQYPSHRPSSKPYNTSRSQKPSNLRLKSNTGIVELDIPIMTSDNYNLPLGNHFGKALHDSLIAHPTTTHGLSGGFSNNTNSANNPMNLGDVPQHGIDTTLHTQTLGGKISTKTDKDPIYMLATLKRNTQEIHLQHLEAVVQLRPQLHHIDAAEEIKRRAETVTSRAKSTSTSANNADPSAPVKLETKAIEVKLKDSNRDDPKDRNQNENAKLLRNIQNDPWSRYEWIEAQNERDEIQALAGSASADRTRLKAALDNDEWLNKMSSPGIELRTRLKGRDRERARRKRQERARNARGAAAASITQDISGSDSADDSSASEGEEPRTRANETAFGVSRPPMATSTAPLGKISDTVPAANANVGTDALTDEKEEATDTAPSSPEIKIKQEASGTNETVPSVPAVPAMAVPKRRGRPPRNKAG